MLKLASHGHLSSWAFMILSGEIKSTIGAAAPAVAITAITETTMIAAVKMLALSASGSKLAWFTNLVRRSLRLVSASRR
ncbi:hypothetical protein E6H16_00855 [Candidatus Bathyarchaeota archaeon]|nr:MAG: hypothetical protein E6H16_00855 [Candidatus Bathyarchaeota archaeon]